MSAAPHIPWTAAQRRNLVCLLKERDLWDVRHEICGIYSLSALTRDQAAALIARLANDRPDRPRPRSARLCRAPRGRGPLDPGELRMASDATNHQRRALRALLERLGWYHGPETLQRGVRGRHEIPNLDTSYIDRGVASDLINELRAAVRRQRPDPVPQGSALRLEAPCPTTPTPN